MSFIRDEDPPHLVAGIVFVVVVWMVLAYAVGFGGAV